MRISDLKKYRNLLTKQEIQTLKGQIKSGNATAAEKGLKRLVNERTGQNDR